MKWARAWTEVDLDFYQVHWYGWLDVYWPHEQAPVSYGLGDRPVVVGEFPMEGMNGASYSELVNDWFNNHYAGTLSWTYDEMGGSDKDAMAAFAAKHPCEVDYDLNEQALVDDGDVDAPACDDIPPSDEYSCEQQANWGKCDKPWMQDYCKASCKRCE